MCPPFRFSFSYLITFSAFVRNRYLKLITEHFVVVVCVSRIFTSDQLNTKLFAVKTFILSVYPVDSRMLEGGGFGMKKISF